jgi:hypothetical protein
VLDRLRGRIVTERDGKHVRDGHGSVMVELPARTCRPVVVRLTTAHSNGRTPPNWGGLMFPELQGRSAVRRCPPPWWCAVPAFRPRHVRRCVRRRVAILLPFGRVVWAASGLSRGLGGRRPSARGKAGCCQNETSDLFCDTWPALRQGRFKVPSRPPAVTKRVKLSRESVIIRSGS